MFHRYCQPVPILKEGHKGNDEYVYSFEGSDTILANGKGSFKDSFLLIVPMSILNIFCTWLVNNGL